MGRKTIEITHPYLTIAGQTAPGPGITLIRTGIDVKTHDVVMRHLRVYTGVDGQSKRSGWEADTFSTVAAQNVIVDHCTFLWGIDENMRSEEHTSELQSLLRTSYAVFCLKKNSPANRNTQFKQSR